MSVQSPHRHITQHHEQQQKLHTKVHHHDISRTLNFQRKGRENKQTKQIKNKSSPTTRSPPKERKTM